MYSTLSLNFRQALTKETVAVLAVSVLLGVIIAVVDLIVRFENKYMRHDIGKAIDEA